MADLGIKKLTEKAELSDFVKFMRWLRAEYGTGVAYSYTPQNYIGSEHFRAWARLGRPTSKMPTAEEKYQAKFRPAPEKPQEYYLPRVPAEIRKQAEQTTPWLYTGQTEEQYKAERPWLQVGITEEDFLRLQMGLPTKSDEEAARWRERREIQSEMWANERARQGMMAEQYNWQAQRWAGLTQGMGGGGGDRQAQAQSYAAGIQEAMALLNPDRDWAQMQMLQTKLKQNPYAPDESNINQLWEDYEMQRAEADRWDRLAKDVQRRTKDPSDPLYMSYDPLDTITPEQRRASNILRAAKTSQDRLFELEGNLAEQATYSWGAPTAGGYPGQPYETETGEVVTGTMYGMGAPAEARPWHPATPGWMSKMYPGATEAQLWGTREGGKPSLAPPDPTAWQRLSPTEQSKWIGYGEYIGADPGKLLTQMGQMLPQPRRGTSWQAARQYA